MAPRPARLLLAAALTALGAVALAMATLRFGTFHNRTFDLAFYARIAWGPWHGHLDEPIVGGDLPGLHLSLVLLPLGALGSLVGQVPVLLTAQALAYALAAWPLARLAGRHFGPSGFLVAGLAWLVQPNLGHVVTGDFHPGTLAVLPLATAALALDRRDARALVLSALGALACREDIALIVAALATVGAHTLRDDRRARRALLGLAAFALGYLALFVFVLHPRFSPPVGSLQLHFGRYGDSFGAIALHLLTHPGELLAHLGTPERLAYLPTVLAPLGLVLPLLSPRLLLCAAPVLAVNLLSQFPTTTRLDSHYLTPAMPLLFAAAVQGAARLSRLGASDRARPRAATAGPDDGERLRAWPRRPPSGLRAAPIAVLGASALLGHVVAGGLPLGGRHDPSAFVPDRAARVARAIVAAIPPGESVQAPDALLAHVAERAHVFRGPPPDRGATHVVLDVRHRRRFRHDESLLRTLEEPVVRDWLAKPGYGVVGGDPDTYLHLRRGADPRAFARTRGVLLAEGDPASPSDVALSACVSVRRVAFRRDERGEGVDVDLHVRDRCPRDLALRLGWQRRPARVDLLFSGVLSPESLRPGDLVRSRHLLEPGLVALLKRRGHLRLGVLRQSGARPDPEDPMTVQVPVIVP
jgi:uncharacterized membrane protein